MKKFGKFTGNVTTLESKLSSLTRSSNRIMKVFTNIVKKLNKANRELSKVSQEAREIAIKHMNMATGAENTIAQNEAFIEKINQFLS